MRPLIIIIFFLACSTESIKLDSTGHSSEIVIVSNASTANNEQIEKLEKFASNSMVDQIRNLYRFTKDLRDFRKSYFDTEFRMGTVGATYGINRFLSNSIHSNEEFKNKLTQLLAQVGLPFEIKSKLDDDENVILSFENKKITENKFDYKDIPLEQSGNALKSILDKILTDPRWDLKFIGMQIIIEGLALAAFQASRELTHDPVLRDMLGLIIRDEARHVTFGINYLEEFIDTLSEEEKEDRAQFAYEACWLSRERLLSTDVYERFGWDVEDARQFQLGTDINQHFQKLLFQRVMPNLRRIGLLRDSVKSKFEDLGILEFASSKSDAEIDWADLSRPLFEETA